MLGISGFGFEVVVAVAPQEAFDRCFAIDEGDDDVARLRSRLLPHEDQITGLDSIGINDGPIHRIAANSQEEELARGGANGSLRQTYPPLDVLFSKHERSCRCFSQHRDRQRIEATSGAAKADSPSPAPTLDISIRFEPVQIPENGADRTDA